jgi:hypothetical protein
MVLALVLAWVVLRMSLAMEGVFRIRRVVLEALLTSQFSPFFLTIPRRVSLHNEREWGA